jgi:hypothetical protein
MARGTPRGISQAKPDDGLGPSEPLLGSLALVLADRKPWVARPSCVGRLPLILPNRASIVPIPLKGERQRPVSATRSRQRFLLPMGQLPRNDFRFESVHQTLKVTALINLNKETGRRRCE